MSTTTTTTTTTTTETPILNKIILSNGVIKCNAVVEEFSTPSIEINFLETNRSEDDFDIAVTNGTFDSVAVESLPEPFFAALFDINSFIYDNYNITNSGSGSASWIENEISTGMLYNSRYGIGYFYFLLINTDDVIEPVIETPYVEEISKEVKYWDWLTTFWDYLK